MTRFQLEVKATIYYSDLPEEVSCPTRSIFRFVDNLGNIREEFVALAKLESV